MTVSHSSLEFCVETVSNISCIIRLTYYLLMNVVISIRIKLELSICYCFVHDNGSSMTISYSQDSKSHMSVFLIASKAKHLLSFNDFFCLFTFKRKLPTACMHFIRHKIHYSNCLQSTISSGVRSQKKILRRPANWRTFCSIDEIKNLL